MKPNPLILCPTCNISRPCHTAEAWEACQLLQVPLNPGSNAAKDAGCQCPVIDNAHGAGYLQQPGIFVMVGTCPLHGWEVR